jgi:lysophospholipase L1-like esterase
LDQHPHHEMLLADGTHLSLAGHQVVADTLFPSLKKLLLEAAK